VLRAVRDTPLDDDDSGRCFACGQDGHETEDYLLVNLDRYARADQNLKDVLGSAINTVSRRDAIGQPWIIEEVAAP